MTDAAVVVVIMMDAAVVVATMMDAESALHIRGETVATLPCRPHPADPIITLSPRTISSIMHHRRRRRPLSPSCSDIDRPLRSGSLVRLTSLLWGPIAMLPSRTGATRPSTIIRIGTATGPATETEIIIPPAAIEIETETIMPVAVAETAAITTVIPALPRGLVAKGASLVFSAINSDPIAIPHDRAATAGQLYIATTNYSYENVWPWLPHQLPFKLPPNDRIGQRGGGGTTRSERAAVPRQ